MKVLGLIFLALTTVDSRAAIVITGAGIDPTEARFNATQKAMLVCGGNAQLISPWQISWDKSNPGCSPPYATDECVYTAMAAFDCL